MKIKTVLFLLLASCMAMQAQTIEVSGAQTGVWEADTVLVVGNVIVEESLTVLPGTKVLFDGFYSVLVKSGASFVAEGKEGDSIVFTVVDTTGFSNYEWKDGGWNGFHLEKAGRVLFDYCVLEYGKAFLDKDWYGGVMNIVKCDDVSVFHSTLRYGAAHERGGALHAVDSKVQMAGCAVNYNTVYNEENMYLYGGGASFLKCDVEMREMEFRGNNAPTIGGALSFDSCSVVLDRSVFVDNIGVNGGGLYLMRSLDKKCYMSNLLFDDNFSRHFGGGFAISDASPEICNVLVVNNSSEGVSCNGVFFYGESRPTLTNCIIYGNYAPESSQHVDTAQMWVWTNEGFAPEFRHCLIEGGLKYIHSAEYIQVFEHILDTDPMFVDPKMHDFRLAEGSPCIDAGDPNTPHDVLNGLDLNGQPRVLGLGIDIGPYECSGASVHQYPLEAPFAKLVGNPLGTHSRIEFEQPMEGKVLVTVYSLTGRCAATEAFNLEGSRRIEIGTLVDRLVPGVYLIEVVSGHGKCTLKAVK